MIEKSSKIQLTTDELAAGRDNVLPGRLAEAFGIKSLEELKKVIAAGEYEIIGHLGIQELGLFADGS